MAAEVFRSTPEPEKQFAHYSLLDALLARRSRRFHCQLAGFFIETGGHRQHYVLFGKRNALLPLPLTLQERKVLGGCLHRRQDAARFFAVPRKQFRCTIGFRV